MQQLIIEPPLYFSTSDIHNLQFHPSNNILSTCLLDGSIEILKYTSEDVINMATVSTLHKAAARHCVFNDSGSLLATCGADGRIGFIDSNAQVVHIIKKAHTDNAGKKQAINRVNFINDNTLISGDEEGRLKIWDLRTTTTVFEAEELVGSITGIHYQQDNRNLIASSQDGLVGVFDVREGTGSEQQLIGVSRNVDEDIYGLAVVKNGKYIVCPTNEGSMLIFRTENVEDYVDRITGFPGSVTAILKVDENTVLSGAEDGFLRGVGVYPNKILDNLGQHEEDENFPIESLAISHCRNIVASTSHDSSIKFYDVRNFIQKRSKFNPETVELEHMESKDRQKDMEEESQFQSFQSSEDELDMPKSSKKSKKRKINLKAREKEIKKEKQIHFFADL